MCGFGGALNSSVEIDRETLRQIASAVSHRGPDSTGLALFSHAFVQNEEAGNHAFFFNRLAIVDLDARSDQPFQNDRYLLIFNGEIYNYREIKTELKKSGVTFATTSDTEVLFYALQVWGVKALGRLNGMFAFFWMDKVKRTFLLARDRTGIKPVYYKLENGNFIFASELDSVVRFSPDESSISSLSVHHYLSLQYIPAPTTILNGIFKLQPGHFISGAIDDLHGKENLVATPYWNAYENLGDHQNIEGVDLEHLLVKSIEEQLEADVPVGLFLSSGVDSSLLAALINKHFSGRSYDFFTIAFDQETTSDESHEAKDYLRGFNNPELKHHSLVVSPAAISSKLESLYRYFDEPFGDHAAMLNWAISEKAREHVTVVLSGDGADELFWGYPRYNQWQANTSRPFKEILDSSILHRFFATLPESRLRYILQNLTEKDPVKAYFNLVCTKSFGYQKSFLNDSRLWFLDGLDPLRLRKDAASVIDFKTYLPDAMLYKVDRSSMASSLEVRVPYLDNKIIDYALRLPVSAKSTAKFRNKAPLKELLSKLATHYQIEKPKKGFNFPLTQWLKDEWREIVNDSITKRNLEGLGLNAEPYLKIIEQFYKKGGHQTTEVWYLLNLVLWFRKFKSLKGRIV